jgi:hypothetical protein
MRRKRFSSLYIYIYKEILLSLFMVPQSLLLRNAFMTCKIVQNETEPLRSNVTARVSSSIGYFKWNELVSLSHVSHLYFVRQFLF